VFSTPGEGERRSNARGLAALPTSIARCKTLRWNCQGDKGCKFLLVPRQSVMKGFDTSQPLEFDRLAQGDTPVGELANFLDLFDPFLPTPIVYPSIQILGFCGGVVLFNMDWLLGSRSKSQAASPSAPSETPSPFSMDDPSDVATVLAEHDPTHLHPLANLDKQSLDYIILQDQKVTSAGALPSRGWTDDLCYGTGITYLSGIFSNQYIFQIIMAQAEFVIALGIGGVWGFIEALQKPRQAVQAHNVLNPSSNLSTAARAAAGSPGFAPNASSQTAARQSGKLIVNHILNHVTRRGPFLGNSAGVLAMTYNLLNAYISFNNLCLMANDSALESWTPVPKSVTPFLSGFVAGAMFRSTKGPKAMAIAGTLVMGAVAAWQGIKRTLV
jgi:mitochondrial import inner membrane translocase subunit TIM23